jgi:hypothetical protein
VSEELKRALARVQIDYGFFIEVQTNPEAALAEFNLNAAERSTLIDPDKLTDMIMRGNGEVTPQAAISVTISGTHDWVNVATPQPDEKGLNTAEHHALIAAQIEAVKRAGTDDERATAVARLVELVG